MSACWKAVRERWLLIWMDVCMWEWNWFVEYATSIGGGKVPLCTSGTLFKGVPQRSLEEWRCTEVFLGSKGV